MLEEEEMRVVYSRVLQEMARKDERIVVLDADLMKPNGTVPFGQEFPERTFDVGVAEANMMGIAAGLSNEGFIPFATTFTPFASRRSFDQFFISNAYAGLNVKAVGTDPGLTAELNGGTHMGFEDVGMMRMVPGCTVVEPADNESLRQLLPQVAGEYGPAYVRLVRKKTHKVFDDTTPLVLGRACMLRDGGDVTLVCTGIVVQATLDAANRLASRGIAARVLNIHTVKPIDEEAILTAARDTGALVSVENHNVINGLGSAIADVLSANRPTPLRKIGVQDRFGEVGMLDYLLKEFRMTPEDIEAAALEVMQLRDG